MITVISYRLTTVHQIHQFFGKKHGTDSILGGMEIENTTLGGNYSQKVHFRTHHFGQTNGRRMTIDEDGNVGINVDGPEEKLDVDGRVVCNALVSKATDADAEDIAQLSGHGSGTLAFGVGTTSSDKFDVYFYMKSNVTAQNVYGSFSATAYGSDDRRKHNEVPILNALDSIMKLRCETYDKTFVLKDENWTGELENEANWLESGLIAQDVYKIPEFKEYVKVGNEKISWDINYNCIFTYNVRATQELKIKVDQLKEKNTNLVNKMYELEMKIDMLMKHVKL